MAAANDSAGNGRANGRFQLQEHTATVIGRARNAVTARASDTGGIDASYSRKLLLTRLPVRSDTLPGEPVVAQCRGASR